MTTYKGSLRQLYLRKQTIDQQLLQTIRIIGETKGKEALWVNQSPQVLESLRSAAIIISTESSNRLEGITAPHQRIVDLVREKSNPQNRSEQEIAGYREVLKIVHLNHSTMDFSANLVLQLHRDLFQYMPQPGGRWKMTDNSIDEVLPNGTMRQRFKTVPAFKTADAMEKLHSDFFKLYSSGDFEPLLLIPAYILDFLCIHPFTDGNGRLSRILTLLLLYQAGYRVGHYISMEQVIEKSKEGYYDSLFESSRNWHEGNHSLIPWWQYFLGVMLLNSYRELEERVGAVTSVRGAKSEMIIDTILHLPRQFRIAEIVEASPAVSRPTINRVLQRMRKAGKLKCIKAGRDALWEKQE